MSRLSRRRACLEIMAPELADPGSRLAWVGIRPKTSWHSPDLDAGEKRPVVAGPAAPGDERMPVAAVRRP